jgi:hypothetical protein
MATRTLDGPPGAATLYPRAVVGSLYLPLLRRVPLVGARLAPGDGATLPDAGLALADVVLDPEHVADYARVCGFGLRDTLPPSYLHVLAFPLAMALMTDPAFPFGVIGLVHVANRIEQRRAVGLGERPTITVAAGDLRPHDRGRQFDVLARATVGDDVVWEGRSTYLRREGGGGGSSKDTSKRPAPPEPDAIIDVPGDIGRRYGAVSGDRNPIHLHGLSARLFGQSSAIAHGMWLKARCLAALEPSLPEAFAAEVAFKLPVALPSKVGFSSGSRSDGGRDFAVHGTRRPVPHLTGSAVAL